jgi:thiol-disulfide isomerase/thioredoxin
MKKIMLFIAFLSLFACREIAPTIPPLGDKKVLVEEFTGVRCVNCPAGASELEDLAALYGDRLVIVSIHAGDFAPPYSDSKFDFRTSEGTELEKLLGAPIGYPAAVINRRKFVGQERLQVFRTSWAGFISEESKTPSILTLGFVKNLNKTTRELSVEVKTIATQALQGDIRLSVMLTESGIKDQQETPQGKKSDYTHKHVLRKMLTKFDGDPLSISSPNEPISKNFTLKIPENWVLENCQIVAFVHKNGSEKDVLQVSEIKISD